MQLDEAIVMVAQHRLALYRHWKARAECTDARVQKRQRRLLQAFTLVKNAAAAQAKFQRKLRRHLTELPSDWGD